MNTNITTKEEIISELKNVFFEVSETLHELDNEYFELEKDGKWSPKENLVHLLQSAKPVIDALNLPKITLLAFGKSKKGSINFSDVVKNYQQKLKEGGKAPSKFIPSDKLTMKSKEELLEYWVSSISKFEEALVKWNEKDLDKYRMPHPLLGKLTVREMLFFTIYHTYHHLKSIS